jgi:hypothetical protein
MVCLIFAIVLGAALPTVPLFFNESATVQNTYAAVDQLVLASEVVTRYVHEAVAPAPASTPFATASANAVTFYTNTGNANGPMEAVAQVVNGPRGTKTFQLSLIPAVVGSCPPCTYGAASQSSVLINNLTNGTGGNPVFTYTLQGGGTCAGPPPGAGGTKLTAALVQGTSYTTLNVQALANAVSAGDGIVIGTGSTTQTVTASGGAAQGATSIPVTSFVANAAYPVNTQVFDNVCTPTQVSQITAVAINVQATKVPGGQPTGYQTLAYLFSPAYNAAVG